MALLSKALIGISGVHFVVSEFSRRGMVALPTIRNTTAYDIVVITPNGQKHANIQVKTSSKRVTFFPMPPSSKVRAGAHDYYVLLRWVETDSSFEGFMLSGRQAFKEVLRGEEFQNKRISQGTRKLVVPSVYVGPKVKGRADKWRKQWLTWKL